MTSSASPVQPVKSAESRFALWADRNFRRLVGGGFISMLGDQITLLALPWLVLRITGDALALGTVFAALGLPRALLILFGGVAVDRYLPKTVLLWTKYLSAAMLGVFSILIFTSTVKLWMIHLLVLGMGLCSAFSLPAGSSLLPRILPRESLMAANGALMSLRQVSLLLGPLAGSALILVFAGDKHAGDVSNAGLGVVFALDCLSFLLSAWTLHGVQVAKQGAHAPPPAPAKALWEGLAAVWSDRPLRTLYLYFGLVTFFVGGPIQVALPTLVYGWPQSDVASLGLLMSGYGAGALCGSLLSTWRPKWRLRTLGVSLLCADAVIAMLFMAFSLVRQTGAGIPLLLLVGLLGGFVQVAVFSWIQRRVPLAMLGRAMGFFTFILVGVAPLSAVLFGLALRMLPPQLLFLLSGLALLVLSLTAMLATPIRRIED
ncbi:MFS transporter [Massilia sp. NR 4-1]|uniref:MFS transporter n=1 Tax=Massilia sp. NR 4-1 TaxID=1678028 RepID=UPI0009E1E485|nr:MFS transporter [Massilia sp. NR 4-1]